MTRYVDESIIKWASRKKNIDMLLDATKSHLVNCSICRLKCLDPPLVSTGLLYDLGYSQYDVRTFWSKLPLGEHKIVLYQMSNGEVLLILQHNVGKVLEIKCEGIRTPVDEFDAKRHGVIVTPNSHRLYVWLSARLGTNRLRINIIRMARLLESYEPSLPDEIITAVRDILWDRRDKDAIVRIIYRELERWRNVLSIVLPHFPKDEEHLAMLMPLIRK